MRCSRWLVTRCEARRGVGRAGRTDGRWPPVPWEKLDFVLAARGRGREDVESDYLDSFLSKKSSGGQAGVHLISAQLCFDLA